MSGSTPLIDHIDFSSAQKEVIVNRVNDAQAPAAVFGIKTLIALSLTVYGGPIDVAGVPTIVSNQTVALTNNTTNYVKASPAGVVSVVTTIPTDWPGPLAGQVTALFTIVTSGSVATSVTEWRNAANSNNPGSNLMLINAQTGTTYTLALLDAALCVEMNNAAANTLTVPANATVAFPIGTSITVRQMGAGLTTIAAAGGVTINKPRTLAFAAQYGTAILHKRATNEWCVDGTLT